MASIGGLTSSTSSSLSSTSSLKGYGGLASGLDRDSLIEAMTSGTQSKIQKQKQNQQKLQWQQEAIRNITDKMYAFSQKYTSYTSNTNLISSSFFSRNQITSVGTNSKYVSVTGNSPLIDQISIAGVKQLAKNAQVSSSKQVSDQIIETEAIDLASSTYVNKLAGTSFSIKYGNDTYQIKLPNSSKYDYGVSEDGKSIDWNKFTNTLNQILDETELKNGDKLSSVMTFKFENNKFEIENHAVAGNSLELVSGDDFFRSLGFLKDGQTVEELGEVSISGMVAENSRKSDSELISEKNKLQLLKEASISFEYNGEVQWIQIDENESAKITDLKSYAEALQKELYQAFGKGRIKVDVSPDNKLSFQTFTPDGSKDNSSTLTITSSTTAGILGKNGILGIEEGASNRFNLNDKLDSSFSGKSIVINGTEIEIEENDTMKTVIEKINNSEAGVEIEYLSNLDKFVVSSKEPGASGEISFGSINQEMKNLKENIEKTKNEIKELDAKIAEAKDENTKNTLVEQKELLKTQKETLEQNLTEKRKALESDPSQKFLNLLKLGDGVDADGSAIAQGQDAIISIKYKGSDKPTDIVRGSNSFKLDGLTISVSGEFGYDETTDKIDPTAAVIFEAKANTDKVTTAVKEMIEAFNEIIDAVSEQVSSKQSASDKYEPLTDQQKAEMSEDQIKQWEEKAKVGILYNDTELRGLMDALRFVLPSGTDRQALSEIGITVSSNYSDNGKLTFDEEKFKAAMESDPDKVKELFTKSKVTDDNGNVTQQAGFMTNIKTVMDRYASTTGATKGILIERAGSQKAPTTVLKNAMQTQLDQIAKTIERLQETLESEQNRYINQFTQLETVISNMNAQSAWLSQLQ